MERRHREKGADLKLENLRGLWVPGYLEWNES